MKRTFILAAISTVLLFCFAAPVLAKVELNRDSQFFQPHSLGLRASYGMGLTYQHYVDYDNLVDLSVNAPYFSGLELSLTYDWEMEIDSWEKQGEWNWFIGVGIGGGWIQKTELNPVRHGFIGLLGHVGVEYEFENAPIHIALEYRPLLGPSFVNDDDVDIEYSKTQFHWETLYNGMAINLSVRYVFREKM